MGVNINVVRLFVFLDRCGEISYCTNYSTSVEGAYVTLKDADISDRYSLSVYLIGIARLANRVSLRIPSLAVRESFLSWITSDSKQWHIRGM